MLKSDKLDFIHELLVLVLDLGEVLHTDEDVDVCRRLDNFKCGFEWPHDFKMHKAKPMGIEKFIIIIGDVNWCNQWNK